MIGRTREHVDLVGYRLSLALRDELRAATAAAPAGPLRVVPFAGPGVAPWRRAEPTADPALAATLAGESGRLDRIMRRLTTFDCAGATLGATLDDAAGATGLLLVTGGTQTRIGAHRGMARLAAAVGGGGLPGVPLRSARRRRQRGRRSRLPRQRARYRRRRRRLPPRSVRR